MYMDQENCPFYIGKGKGHRWYPSKHSKGQTMTARKVRKIGSENIKVHFLHKDLTGEEAIKYERYWIKYLGRKDNGTGQLTNHTDGGEGSGGYNKGRPGPMRGKHHSEETKQRMSESAIGRKHSEDHKRKNRDAHIGKPAWNKGLKTGPLSDKQKKKISDSMKGQNTGPKSEETKRKISETLMGNIPWNKGNGRK